MVEKICEYCKKPFLARKNRIDTTKFCSKECRKKDSHITFECIVCKKNVSRQRGIVGGTYKFCSWACHDIHRTRKVVNICKACGNEFTERPSKNDHKFCSWSCYIGYIVRENSPHWRGGERGRKYYPKAWNNTFKKMIRERDNYTCAVCKEYGDNVHHINYVKNDTIPENCITLCRVCHAKTNSNREYWIKYFSSS